MITQQRVKELFDYKDGVLIRKINVRKEKAGEVAGYSQGDGYSRTTVDYKSYRNHRLVWLWHYGYMPEEEVDHIDRNKKNNRIENLREITRKCNLRNSKLQTNNTSTVKGVGWHKATGKWRVDIKVDQKQHSIMGFTDFVEAVAHRLAAEQCLNWSSCDSSSPAFQYIQKYLRGLI